MLIKGLSTNCIVCCLCPTVHHILYVKVLHFDLQTILSSYQSEMRFQFVKFLTCLYFRNLLWFVPCACRIAAVLHVN